MKTILVCFGLVILLQNKVECQSLILKGRVKCLNDNVFSTRGAENLIVVPAFMPSKSTITGSQPTGYFEFNTGLPISKLQDKTVAIYLISACTDCKAIVKRVFISEDQDRQNRNDSKEYVTIRDWTLNARCDQAELSPLKADSILRMVEKQPDQSLENVSAATALVGTPAILNLLTTITPVLGVLPNAGPFQVQTLESGKINYGKFLLSSPLYESANTGFNFSPSRDMSEAVFWNPSAIAFGKKPNNISLFTNVRNNVKLGGFVKIGENISLGAGGIYTLQDERRKAVFAGVLPDNDPNNTVNVDSLKMKLKEYAIFLSPVFKVNEKFSLGFSLKSVWQNFNIPNLLTINDVDGTEIGTFNDSIINNQYFDFDVSATLKLTGALQLGLNLMNLAGTELYSDAFVPGKSYSNSSHSPKQKLRSLGLGLTYKWQRLNVGADLLFTENELYDATVGINFVPFNNALLSAGYALKQQSYSLAFRIKNFRIAYVNDNGWMINEKRTGKASILNGKIYGGFIFDLN